MKESTSTRKTHSTRTSNTKYLAAAIKLLKQSRTMFKALSEESDNREMASRCESIAVHLNETMNSIELLNEYTAPTRNRQLSINFE